MKHILVIGLTIVISVSVFVVACGAGAPPPAMSSMALPQNKSPTRPIGAVTPGADSPPKAAIVPEQPKVKSDSPTQDQQRQAVAAALATPVIIADMGIEDQRADTFDGKYLNKIQAAEFLSAGVEVTVLNVGPNFFDIETDEGERYRIESPVKPKFVNRFVNEYGLSDIEHRDGLEEGLKGILKSSRTPENIMGVGPNVIGVTPEASDGIGVSDVIPVFTLSSPPIIGPNDYLIKDEMDYTIGLGLVEKSGRKRWFEMYKAQLKGVIWQIFEQSNRYFTMVDKREWDRFTPGYIFSLMQQFEYLIPIPDRILSVRNPKILSTEEQLKNRYILHDYSIGTTSIRVLIPTFSEIKQAEDLKPVHDGKPSVGYISITASLTDAELGDGEKFTWNSPVKLILYVEGRQYTLYMPLLAALEVDGKMYSIPRSGVR